MLSSPFRTLMKFLFNLFIYSLLTQALYAQKPAFKLDLKEVPIEEFKKRDLIEVGFLHKGFIAQNVLSLNAFYDEVKG